MRVLTIMGTPNKGNTRSIADLFLKEFEDNNTELMSKIKELLYRNLGRHLMNRNVRKIRKIDDFER